MALTLQDIMDMSKRASLAGIDVSAATSPSDAVAASAGTSHTKATSPIVQKSFQDIMDEATATIEHNMANMQVMLARQKAKAK